VELEAKGTFRLAVLSISRAICAYEVIETEYIRLVIQANHNGQSIRPPIKRPAITSARDG
jgi:hypothetical protein